MNKNSHYIKKFKLETDKKVTALKEHFIKFLEIKNIPGQGIFIWAEIDKKTRQELDFKIIAIGEDQTISEELKLWDYLGTIIDDNNNVWHYYGTPFYNFPEMDDNGNLHEVFFEAEMIQ